MGLEVHDAMGTVVPEWDDLADRVEASPFQRPGWLKAWWRAFGVGKLNMVALRDQGRLVGLVPVCRVRGVLRSLTNPHTPEYGLLVERDYSLRLVRALFAQPQRRITLAYLLPGPPDLADYEAVAAEMRYRLVRRPLERSPYVEVQGEWASFEDGLSPKLRADLRRRDRRLAERGSVSVDVNDGRQRLDQLLAEGFRVEAVGWKGSSGTRTAIMCHDDTLRFYTEVARWASQRGVLRLSFLRLDGVPLAFEYALEDGGVYYRLKAGFDPEYGNFAPGKLLILAMLRRAFESGLRRFSFLGHGEPYKLEWSKTTAEYPLLHAFGPNPSGRLEWSAYNHLRPIARRIGLRR